MKISHLRLLQVALLWLPGFVLAQSLSGTEVVDNAITFHDPQNQWQQAHMLLNLTEQRPSQPTRQTLLEFDHPHSRFRLSQQRGEQGLQHLLDEYHCRQWLNYREPTHAERQANNLNCERTTLLRNYYGYLWGMPMKLRDPGTLIDPNVQETEFHGQSALAVRVTYSPEVGSDIWYFYFSAENYALVGYRFYHDEAANDGEYVLLDGLFKLGAMQLPQQRRWFTNAAGQLLGEDTLANGLWLGEPNHQ